MKTLRLGTRKSALAQAQANGIADRLRASFPDLRIELVLITTSGDQRTSGVEEKVEGGLKALFTKELDEALLDARIDLAVHSMKDLAGDLPLGLVISAVPEREDPRDAWISKNKSLFHQLPPRAKVGTGAVRRQAQLKHARPDLQLVPLRGNVDTRLRKLAEGDLEGIVLALAGLKRLGRAAEATETLSPDLLLPAVGQGCLAIESRQNDTTIKNYLKVLDHPSSHTAALAERAFLKTLGGSCQTPIAAYAELTASSLHITGLVADTRGEKIIRDQESGPGREPEAVGERLARKLLAAGADRLLQL
jgi:hydroxymethylbilane synthase